MKLICSSFGVIVFNLLAGIILPFFIGFQRNFLIINKSCAISLIFFSNFLLLPLFLVVFFSTFFSNIVLSVSLLSLESLIVPFFKVLLEFTSWILRKVFIFWVTCLKWQRFCQILYGYCHNHIK